jgi:hypothetical protein
VAIRHRAFDCDVAEIQLRVTLPAFRHLVQTLICFTLPSTTA